MHNTCSVNNKTIVIVLRLQKMHLEVFILLILSFFIGIQSQNVAKTLLKFLRTGENRLKREFPDQSILRAEYDFIIIGAGYV